MIRKLVVICFVFVISFLSTENMCFADQTIVAKKIDVSPVIDGDAGDSVWDKSKFITTYDNIANLDISLKAVYNDEKIFFLVIYLDKDESSTHKSWRWNKALGTYAMNNDVEDVFVFKWPLSEDTVDLSIFGDNPYSADVWFWKACRTNPVGYADDKIQFLSSIKIEESKKLKSKSGKNMYLVRKGDKGTSSYKSELSGEYKGDKTPRFTNRTPTGSRADIKSKGKWNDGKWTIEFSRLLKTGNDDDVQFDITKSYHFGVSRYEIAGRKVNNNLTQPLYGSGDVGERITLIFDRQ